MLIFTFRKLWKLFFFNNSTLMSSPVCVCVENVWVCVSCMYVCIKQGILMCTSTAECPWQWKTVTVTFLSVCQICYLLLHHYTPSQTSTSLVGCPDPGSALCAHAPASTFTFLSTPQICSLETHLCLPEIQTCKAPQLLGTWDGSENDGNLKLI